MNRKEVRQTCLKPPLLETYLQIGIKEEEEEKRKEKKKEIKKRKEE